MQDTIVIGAGIAGRSVARNLGLHNVAVLLVDTDEHTLSSVDNCSLDMPPSVSSLNAGAFLAERKRVWLNVSGNIEARPYSKLVIATGANPIGSTNGALLASGTLPDARLAALQGCAFRYDETAKWLLVTTDARSLETSIEGVYVIGAARGAAGRESAQKDAALCTSHLLGRHMLSDSGAADPARRTWRSEARANSLPDNAIMCPSCGVSAGDVRSAARHGVDRLDLLGRLIGAAEGECRGRPCSLLIGLVLADVLNRRLCEVLQPPTEFPAIPIPFAHLAEIAQDDLIPSPTTQDSGGLR